MGPHRRRRPGASRCGIEDAVDFLLSELVFHHGTFPSSPLRFVLADLESVISVHDDHLARPAPAADDQIGGSRADWSSMITEPTLSLNTSRIGKVVSSQDEFDAQGCT